MKLKQVGITEANQMVISNVFKLFDTYGTPLEVIFFACKESKIVPSWIHFYDEALNHGWTHKTIMSRLIPAISDIYGSEYAETVETRLKSIFGGHRDKKSG